MKCVLSALFFVSSILVASPLPTLIINNDLSLIPYDKEPDCEKRLEDIVNDPEVYPSIRHGNVWDKKLIQARHNAYIEGNRAFEQDKPYCAEDFTVCWFVKFKGHIVGRMGFQPEDEIKPIMSEIFIALKDGYQSIGVGIKTCKAIQDWFHQKYPSQPLRWLSMENNERAKKIALKLGFKQLFQKNGKSPYITVNWGMRYLAFEENPRIESNT